MLKMFLFVLMRYSKMVNNKDMQFCRENLKMNRKRTKKILTLRSGDSNPRFSVIFPPMIWIYMEGEGDKIKSKQASKRDRTFTLSDILPLLNFNQPMPEELFHALTSQQSRQNLQLVWGEQKTWLQYQICQSKMKVFQCKSDL